MTPLHVSKIGPTIVGPPQPHPGSALNLHILPIMPPDDDTRRIFLCCSCINHATMFLEKYKPCKYPSWKTGETWRAVNFDQWNAALQMISWLFALSDITETFCLNFYTTFKENTYHCITSRVKRVNKCLAILISAAIGELRMRCNGGPSGHLKRHHHHLPRESGISGLTIHTTAGHKHSTHGTARQSKSTPFTHFASQGHLRSNTC